MWLRNASRETILYSENPSEDDKHVKGVGQIMSRLVADSLPAWAPVQERIITALFAPNAKLYQLYKYMLQTLMPPKKKKSLFTK